MGSFTKPKLNILIYVLDDYRPALEAIEESFNIAGISGFKMFTNATDFLSSLNEDVHIAVIDYLLKGDLTGLQVCRMLIEKYPQCFVIIMSAQEDNSVIIDFMNSGADRYVSRKDSAWLDNVIKYVNEGMVSVQKNLDWYYELISRKKEYSNAQSE